MISHSDTNSMNKTGLVLDAHTLEELKVLAKMAENAGFHSIWATELYRTSFQQISAALSVTKNILLGSSVALSFTRSPLITALTAMDIDELSNGRLILGLGSGARRTNERFHGVTHGKPVKHIKECVELIRDIIRNSHRDKHIRYEGEYYDIDMKGYKRPFVPVRENIPVFLAGIGINMTSASAKTADGYIGHVVCSEEYLRNVTLPGIKQGLKDVHRNREDFTVSSIITCAVSDDLNMAKRAAKATIAFYALVKTYEKPFKMHGFDENTKKIRDAYFRKDVEGMIANVSDEMVDIFALVGDEDYCQDRLQRYREYLDLPILSVPHYFIDFEEIKHYQENLIKVFGK